VFQYPVDDQRLFYAGQYLYLAATVFALGDVDPKHPL
jgi:hypothetical protein